MMDNLQGMERDLGTKSKYKKKRRSSNWK